MRHPSIARELYRHSFSLRTIKLTHTLQQSSGENSSRQIFFRKRTDEFISGPEGTF